MERYQDFVIRISPAGQGMYRVNASSPAGEAATTFVLPFDEKDLKIFMLEVGRPRSASSRGRIPDFMRPTVDFGHSLYKAVIHNGVRDLFIRTLQNADQHNEGLRIRLRLNEAPDLAHLPWEFLYDGRDFLALSDASPLVRYLDLPNPPRRLAVDLPLRILVTISAPRDLPVLDVELEQTKIEQALSRLVSEGMVKLAYTEDASLNTLQRVLRRAKSGGEPFHVWHYIGHGAYDPEQQTSMLALTNVQGMLQMVSGFELGTLLQNFSELRLALLNACEGARSGNEDPFAGVSTALVEYGIPAVIAMQFEISDQAAIAFASEFYAALVDGLGLDTAVTNARRTVFFMPNYVEWATPVLYLRSPESRIFEIVSSRPRAVRVEPKLDTQARQDEAQKLLSLYVKGLSDFYLERWESAVHHLQTVVAGQADYEDAAEKLAEARYKLELTTLYQQSQSSIQAGAWEEAIASLQQLLAKEPGYLDGPALLAEAQRNKQLGDLYEQAGLLFQASQWQAVMTVFERLDEVDPQFLDTKNFRQQARENQVREERARKLEKLYAQALLRIKESDLTAAQQALEEVLAIDPEYEDTSALLGKVREERLLKEREQKLEGLYAGARQAIQKGDFAYAQDSLEQLLAISQEYRDAPALLEKVKAERERKEKEQKLQALKTQALMNLNAREYDAAQEALEQVLSLDPQYEDAEALLEKVNSERASQEKQRLDSQKAAAQAQQLEGLYTQARDAVHRKDWPGASSLLEQVRAIRADYKDTPKLLARVTRSLEKTQAVERAAAQAVEKEFQPGTVESQVWPNILKGPLPLLAWVGLHVLAWVGLAVGNTEDVLRLIFIGVMILILAGTNWFFLRKNLARGAARWGVLTALGISIGIIASFAIVIMLDSIGVYIDEGSAPLLFGIVIAVFAVIAARLQTRYLPAGTRDRRLWISSGLVQGVAWYLYLKLAFYHGTGYYEPELMNTAILVGLMHGLGTGLALNWILGARAQQVAVEHAQAESAAEGIASAGSRSAMRREGWSKAQDLLAKTAQTEQPQKETGRLLAWLNILNEPVPLLPWTGLHILVWILFVRYARQGPFFEVVPVSILALLFGGIQWFLLRKVLHKAALPWAILTASAIIFARLEFDPLMDFYHNNFGLESFPVGIGFTMFLFAALAGWLQSRLLSLRNRESLLWASSSLALGIAWFIFLDRGFDYGFYSDSFGLIVAVIIAGLVHGGGTGLALNRVLGVPINGSARQPKGIAAALDTGLWWAPIPLVWWVGVHVLGWIILSFTSFDNGSLFLLAGSAYPLVTAVGQWFFLRQVLPDGAARWGILTGLSILVGAFIWSSIFQAYWEPPFIKAVIAGVVMALAAGAGGFIQSRFLPVDPRKRVLWLYASLSSGIAWFLFLNTKIVHGYYGFSDMAFIAALLVGLIHASATGLTLNAILSQSDHTTG